MGNLCHKRHPCLADCLIEDRLMEIRDDDGPKPLIGCLSVPVEFDQRRAEHSVGSADHGLKQSAFVFEMMQDDTLGNACNLADLLKCRPTESINDHSLECRL